MLDEQDRRVCFEVDTAGALDDLETFDRDVSLIGKAEADEVKHWVRRCFPVVEMISDLQVTKVRPYHPASPLL